VSGGGGSGGKKNPKHGLIWKKYPGKRRHSHSGGWGGGGGGRESCQKKRVHVLHRNTEVSCELRKLTPGWQELTDLVSTNTEKGEGRYGVTGLTTCGSVPGGAAVRTRAKTGCV